MSVVPGLEVLAQERTDLVAGRRVGVLCHAASVDRRLTSALDVIAGIDGVRIVALFGPEHGLFATAQDMIAVQREKDPSAPSIHSLYGDSFDSLSPSPESLAGLDALVVDLQDVGARYYTYVWTTALAMAACGAAGVRVVVCDRPNPLGGAMEGGPIARGYSSFVGLYSVPQRHGCTIGELMTWLVRSGRVACELTVVPCAGWQRSQPFDGTGLPWVLPSPNMPTLDTAWVYPGICLLEGTNLSEGRGTTRPFEIFGAPWIDERALAARLDAADLPGASFRPLRFQPTFHKHGGTVCGGVQLHVTDRQAFRPVRTGCEVLAAAREVGGERFQWRTERYEFVDRIPAVDLLAGGPSLRETVDSDGDLEALCTSWEEASASVREELRSQALYS